MIKTDVFRTYSNVDPQHPYPGLYSFRETESEFFYGRNREINELENLIGDNVLTIVFGKSGVGKTSLLRAGLIPRLRNNYFLPVYLRIDFGREEKRPIEQVKETIASAIKGMDPNAKPFEDLTLWEYFSSVKILNGYVKPLLFFDQFEEMFTTGKSNPENVNEFITEMADLIENRVPVSVQEKLGKEKKTIAYAKGGPGFRVVFSLREDYLPQLEMLYRYIPALRFSRYRVSQLQGKDAIDAVLKPGKEIITDPEVGVEIIKKIPGAKGADYKPYENVVESWETKKIEPFLLSLFCYQVNAKRLEAKAKEISGESIKDISTEDIIKDYYEENINRFEPNVKTAIEDLLLTEEGYRKLQEINSLKTGYGVMDKDIEELIKRRIIRKETRVDIEYIELIHDVLTPILKESRDKRKEEGKRKKELAERKKRYHRVIAAIVSVAVVFLVLLALYAFRQKAAAEKESRINKAYELAAYSADVLDKDPALSFRLAERAYKAEKTNLTAYRALLGAFYGGGFHPEVYKDKGEPFKENKGSVNTAAFSPDGKYILTGSGDKTVRLLTKNNFLVFEFKGFKDIIHTASFSPDGKYILIAPARGPAQLRLIDPEEIIRIVNSKGDVRQLTDDEKETYNLQSIGNSTNL
jgi:hypothetical protein